MLQRLSKILVVFVATASVAFVGFALALNNAGPNWTAEAESLTDYTFTYTPGENPTWVAKYRNDTQQLGPSPELGEVVVKAYADAKQRNEKKTSDITPLIPPIVALTKQIETAVAQDTEGIRVRHEQLMADARKVDGEIAATGLEGDRNAEQAITIRTETERRRESVFRLRRELDQIENDHYFQLGQRQRLLDRLHQLEGIRLRLQQRNRQLLDAGAKPQAAPEA